MHQFKLPRTLVFTLAIIIALGVGMVHAACPGCCSSHGGVSSSCAANGRIVCVDGSTSPSCTCASCGVTTPTPTPVTCTGGRTLVGSICVCPGGTQWAALDGVCHTPIPASACGVDRWKVKTGSDTTVGEVDPTVIPTTVTNMRAFAAPTSLSSITRIGSVERTTFILDAALTDYEMTDDSDYHLVIRGSAGETMIVEVPHPSCVSDQSPYKAQITVARAAVDNALATVRSFKTTATPVRVAGLGFFDDLHGQRGVAPNGVELHPVTAIVFAPATALPANPDVTVIEYYSVPTDSYFVTGRTLEKSTLDALPNVFQRTGMSFASKAGIGSVKNPMAICRYFYTDKAVNSSHFYGAGADCASLATVAKTNAFFNDEGFDFLVGEVNPRLGGLCPSTAPVAVLRSFREGSAGKTVNHRYTVSQATYLATNAKGYSGEGVAYCVTSATDVR